jgi:hypothetical protein
LRFISPYPKYKLVAVHQTQEVLASGQPRVIAPGFIAEWRPHDATTAEREQARGTFTYRGTVTDEGGRQIDPIDGQHRIGVFDTREIGDLVLRERVEAALQANPAFGFDYILAAEPVTLAPPWPAYDKLVVQGRRTIDLVVEKIAATVSENGYDPALVAEYERQNLNRREVLEALEPVEADAVEFVAS